MSSRIESKIVKSFASINSCLDWVNENKLENIGFIQINGCWIKVTDEVRSCMLQLSKICVEIYCYTQFTKHRSDDMMTFVEAVLYASNCAGSNVKVGCDVVEVNFTTLKHSIPDIFRMFLAEKKFYVTWEKQIEKE